MSVFNSGAEKPPGSSTACPLRNFTVYVDAVRTGGIDFISRNRSCLFFPLLRFENIPRHFMYVWYFTPRLRQNSLALKPLLS